VLRNAVQSHQTLTLLRAYEISTVHNREPPPKEILEDVSAKGGDLLNRTVENFFPPGSRETERLRNGDEDSEDEEEEGDVKRTPRDDKMDVDEPGSLGRSTRCTIHDVVADTALLMNYCSTSPCAPTACALSARGFDPSDAPIRRHSELTTSERIR
jgi:hypothetical protein